MWKRFWCRIRAYVLSVLIALGVGGLGAFVSRSGMERFSSLNQPPLSPPAWVFPVVWSILYVLMGVSAGMVYKSEHPMRSRALKVYAAQLALNFGWTVLYFAFGLYWAAFLWLLVLILCVARMIYLFYQVSRPAGLLQLPYLLWTLFAAYLNAGIALLNR